MDQLLRRQLPGALLRQPLSLAGPLAAHADLHEKGLGVLRPALLDGYVARLRELPGLRHLLQSALVIDHLHFIFQWSGLPHDLMYDEEANRLDAAIQVNGSNQSFQGIGEKGLFSPSSAHFLAAPQEQVGAQIETQRDLMKVGGAHQVRLPFRESSFGISRVARDQLFADQEAENGIAQKFELLVVGRPLFRLFLMNARLVRERPLQQAAILEMMTENSLENFDLRRRRLDGSSVAGLGSKNSTLPEAWLRPFVYWFRLFWPGRWI